VSTQENSGKKTSIVIIVVALVCIVGLSVYALIANNNGIDSDPINYDYPRTTNLDVDLAENQHSQVDISYGQPTLPAELAGAFQTTMPAASGGTYTVGVQLDVSGAAVFTQLYDAREPGEEPIVEPATWTFDDELELITLTISEEYGGNVMQFTTTDGNELILVNYDLSVWGEMGLTLLRQ
jgi:hypothetical protein